MEIDPGIAVAIGLGIFSTLATVVTALVAFRGGMPAAADDMATGFATLNAELRQELVKVREELKHERIQRQAQQEEINILKRQDQHRDQQMRTMAAGIQILIGQLRANGIEPHWTPPADLLNTGAQRSVK